MLKRLWMIFGPVLIAGLLVFLLIFFYPTEMRHNLGAEKRSAVATTIDSFKERSQKVRALSDPSMRFVPFFGSSEWLRFDGAHPAVLAEKYNRSYRPYLLGQRGAASLNQYFGMQQILSEIENKQAVFVISPQWFTESDYEPAVFQEYFNSDQLTSFLENQSGDISSQHASKRLLKQFSNVSMKDIVQKIANKESLSEFDHMRIEIGSLINQKQANFFGQFSIRQWLKYKEHVEKYLNTIPDQFSYQAIEDVVKADAEKNTSNNEFGMDNRFYDTQIRDYLKKLKGSQTSYNYLKSSEYNDLQLVLTQFSKSKVNPIFIIPPVNKKWMDYAGLREDMYQQTVQKIRYQLESQGFNNIADFSKDGGEPFFMKDTIHLGWLGWLAFDKAVDPFLSNPTPAPTYHLNERFFSKDWATYDGDVKEFQ
ncbi:D-alanyl-lipoteichoic acid biosynthesis protein DltD [Streptococcus sp. 959]|uniref:D-alanyl-lipoteichoic acid biosynthesis protein DltD n=1 Tax=Streptococcus sp. 959 TaxID=2582655 RepID=UPI001563B9E3|nr:D-alanyl-lipoteichoic acid biosynthesis protein DltD [Streptococcus sp. 959]